ncbi:MAG: DUF2214 family protein [Myxococcota bacterium]
MGSFLSAAVASVHLVCFAVGVASMWLRRRALLGPLDDAGIGRVLMLDNVAGINILVWMGTGLWRAFGGLEKGADYYTDNWMFWAKLGLLGVVWGFELRPMLTFIRWRAQRSRGLPVDTRGAAAIARSANVELALVFVMAVLAAFMARGGGQLGGAPTSALERGAEVYAASCAPCLQVDGRGLGGKLAADFVGDASRLAKPDDALLGAIAKGVPRTAMVGFDGRLDAADQRAALAYIRQRFGGGAAPAAAPPAGPVPPLARPAASVPAYPIAAGKGAASIFYDRAGGSPDTALTLLVLEPGAAVPPHVHEASDELLYVIDGAAEMKVEAEALTLGPGDAVRIPKGRRHEAKVVGDRPLRAVQVYAPAGPEQRFVPAARP